MNGNAATSGEPAWNRAWSHHAAFLVASGLVLVLAAVLEVRDQRVTLPGMGIGLPDSCWFKRLTGWGCPGCGLTRSMICLVHGNFFEAWRFNPGGYLFFLLIAAQLPYRVAQIWRIRHGLSPWRLTDASLVFVGFTAAVLLAQWMVRWWGYLS